MLEIEKARIDKLRPSLENRKTELENFCRESEAQAKIEVIAAGILCKNYKFVRQLEEVEARAKQLIERMNHVKDQMDALKLRLNIENMVLQKSIWRQFRFWEDIEGNVQDVMLNGYIQEVVL